MQQIENSRRDKQKEYLWRDGIARGIEQFLLQFFHSTQGAKRTGARHTNATRCRVLMQREIVGEGWRIGQALQSCVQKTRIAQIVQAFAHFGHLVPGQPTQYVFWRVE